MIIRVSKTNLDTDSFPPVAHCESIVATLISAVIRCRELPKLCCGVEKELLLFKLTN